MKPDDLKGDHRKQVLLGKKGKLENRFKILPILLFPLKIMKRKQIIMKVV